MPINISMHITTKFCHVHKTKFTHANKFSHIHHEYIHISWTQSFHNANTPKIQTKIHPTTSQITYIVKIPNATNIAQIAPRSKKKHTSKMFQSQHSKHDQSHNAPKISKVTISHHETFNETCNNIFLTKEKLTLLSTWQHGAWVLGSWRSPSSSFQSNFGSYFLPWEARKEEPLKEEAILMQRKRVLENGFHKKWVWDENAQNTKI